MTPSSPPSYQFLEPTPLSPLINHVLLEQNTQAHVPYSATTPSVQHETSTPLPTAGPTQQANHLPQPTNPPTTAPTTPLPNTPPMVQAQQHSSPPPYNPKPTRTHTMVTRSQSGIVKPIERLSLHTSSISPIPKSPFLALNDPNWCNAMNDEYNALHKFHADGILSRYKARLVANGSSQQLGVDFDETFSPVVKPATIRMVLSLDVSRQWPIHQLDVKNAFLNGVLSETVYMHQPPGFIDSRYPHHGNQVAYLLIYVDDIILTASSPALLQQIIGSLHKEFDMTDLGALNYFLGVSAVRHSTGLFLSQKKYALQLLERAHMVNCNPSRTPVDSDAKLGPAGVPVQDPTLYHSLAGGLQYLTFTCPDLSYAVQKVCLYMHDLRETHFATLKRVLRYVQGTLDFGQHLYASATTSLVGYTDADWAGCPSTRRSTSGYCVFLGDNLLSWSSKRQHTISRSSAKAEYRGVANVVAETTWIRNLLPGHVRVHHVPSHFQYADIFTKGLPSALFEDFRSSLSVRPPFAQTAGAY
ncbi:ribonuclease H-like domain-containing protein [Tanacetum coccineum]|uniref:Ribonuclease H-like domain-containing protein n=1 Tax=Tanacetum coccineum TaxID=301880 RepID=A0ABQ4XNX8_9ASTR